MTNKELLEKIESLETELAEVKEMAEAMKKKADGGEVFKPKDGQDYWFISGSGEVYQSKWYDDWDDRNRYEIGNCYLTKHSAEDAVRVLKLIQKARESQNGFVPDLEGSKQRKYSLRFQLGNIDIESCASINTAPTLGYWGNKMVCRLFIEDNYDELIWFFTEYRR